jgi:hypothetical protein
VVTVRWFRLGVLPAGWRGGALVVGLIADFLSWLGVEGVAVID